MRASSTSMRTILGCFIQFKSFTPDVDVISILDVANDDPSSVYRVRDDPDVSDVHMFERHFECWVVDFKAIVERKSISIFSLVSDRFLCCLKIE